MNSSVNDVRVITTLCSSVLPKVEGWWPESGPEYVRLGKTENRI